MAGPRLDTGRATGGSVAILDQAQLEECAHRHMEMQQLDPWPRRFHKRNSSRLAIMMSEAYDECAKHGFYSDVCEPTYCSRLRNLCVLQGSRLQARCLQVEGGVSCRQILHK